MNKTNMAYTVIHTVYLLLLHFLWFISYFINCFITIIRFILKFSAAETGPNATKPQ